MRIKYTRTVLWSDNLFRKFKKNKKFNGNPKKILFLRIDRIGDAVVTLPFLRDLKLNYPELEIHVLASKRNYRFFAQNDFTDKLYEYDENLDFYYPTFFKRFFFFNQIFHILKMQFRIIFGNDKENILANLKAEKYDAVVDLTGDKRSLYLSRLICRYNAGARILFFSFLYKYRLETTWVDVTDTDYIYKKYEKLVNDAFGLKLTYKDKTLPYVKYPEIKSDHKFEIVIHLSDNNIRALSTEKEIVLFNSLSSKKLCLIDYGESDRLKKYRDYYKNKSNVSLFSYSCMEDIRKYLLTAKLFITYDGGQSHYSAQFIKTLVIFGSTSPHLWKPNEFENYKLLKKWDNGVIAEKSNGKFGHLIIYNPIWCNPCFDIGCKTKPCLQNIEPEQVLEIVKSEI